MSDTRVLRAEKLLSSGKLPEEKAAKIRAALDRYVATQSTPSEAPAMPDAALAPPGESLPMESASSPIVSYDQVAQESAEHEKKQADLEPSLPSASKKMSLFFGPTLEAMNPQAGSTLQWVEPTLEEAANFFSESKAGDKLADLQQSGEDSEAYKDYADGKWKKAAMVLQRHGQGAVRLKYLQPRTAGELGSYMAGNIAEPFFGALDDMLAFGAGKQALSAMSEPTPAEKELIGQGLLLPLAERIRASQSQNTAANIAGGLGAMLTPWGAAQGINKVAGIGMKGVAGAKFVPRILAKLGIIGASGAAQEGGIAAVEGRAAGDVADRASSAILPSIMFGAPIEAAGALGNKAVTALRSEKRAVGEALNQYEKVSGGQTRTGILEGVKPPEALAAEVALRDKSTSARIQERNRDVSEWFGEPKPGEAKYEPSAEATIEGRLVQPLKTAAVEKRASVLQQMTRENELYYNSPQGQQSIPVKEVGDRIIDLKKRYTDSDGEILPFVSNSDLDKAFVKIMDKSSTEVVNQQIANLKSQGLDDEIAKYVAPKLSNGRGSMTDDGYVIIWRDLNARQLDDSISAIDDKVRAEANRPGGNIPTGFDELQEAIRRTRERFGANDVAPRSLTATIQVKGRNGQIEDREISGWAALKNRHHHLQNETDNAFYSSGLGNADRVEPDLAKQNAAVFSAVRQIGNQSRDVEDKVLHDLLKDNRETLKWLMDVHQLHAYSKTKAQAGDIKASAHGTSVSAWMSGLATAAVHVDPVFQAMQQLMGMGPMTAAVAAQNRGTGAERQLQRASALDPKEVDQAETLVDRFKRAYDNGSLDDLIE